MMDAIHDDKVYVKLVKPTLHQNWDKQKRRVERDKEIRRFTLFVVVLFIIVFVGIGLIRLNLISDIYTSQPNKTIAKFGDSGYIVYEVQDSLAEHGYTVLVDGRFGAQTQQAIASWQKSNGLSVTRVIDEMTLESLGIDP